jgi:MFS family permease
MKSAKAVSWQVLAACYFGMVFDGLDASIFGLTLHPCLSELLQTKSGSAIGMHGSYVMATFLFGWMLGAIVFGVIADRFGRAKTLSATVLVYAVFTGLCATSHSWTELAFYRFLVGMGIGGEISIGGVMVAEAWKGNARLYATGALQTGYSVGFLLLSALNLVIGSYGWRWLYVAGIAPALLAFYIRYRLRDSEDAQTVIQYRKKLETDDHKPDDHESRLLKLPIVELFMPENRKTLMVLVALSSTTCIGSFAVLAWLPSWINDLVGHVAVNERSYATLAQNCGAILGAASGGFFVLKFGRKASFRIAFLGAMTSMLCLYLTVQSYGFTLLAWAALSGFFVLAPFTYLFIYVPELFDTRLRATAFGFSIQCGRIFAGLAAILGGQLVAFFGGSFAKAAAALSLVYLVGIIATFFMPLSPGKVSVEMETLPSSNEAPV